MTRAHVPRRSFVRWLFLGSLGAGALGATAGVVAMLYPQSPERISTLITIEPGDVPAPGDAPIFHKEGKFWLVPLARNEGRDRDDGDTSDGGLLALSSICPHEGCTVVWDAHFVYAPSSPHPVVGTPGWFRCPCGGSVFTKAGVRVFGPAPRAMDTLLVTVTARGAVAVDPSRRTLGSIDNPHRAVPYPAPRAAGAPARFVRAPRTGAY
jgi:cytochrome b6-f complex iron-sulfur subunit